MGTAKVTGDGMQLYRRLLGYVVPYWRRFLIAILAMGCVAATEAGFAMLMKPMMDGTFVERDPEVIKWTPIVLIVIFLIRGAASFASSYLMEWIARHVILALRRGLFEKFLRLPVTYFDNTPSGTLLSRLVYDVEQVTRASSTAITVLVKDSLTVVGLLGWMFYIEWRLALTLMIGAPLVSKVISVVSKRFRRYSSRVQSSVGDITHIAQEVIEGHREIKTFGAQEYEAGRFEAANENNCKLNMKMATTNAASVPVVQLIAALASAGVIYYALSMLDTLTIGTFVSFVASMMMLHSPMKRLTQINAALQKGIAAAESIFGFIDETNENDSGTKMITRVNGAVSIEDLSFAYSQSKGDVLKNINLTIEPHETVAFVGRSGSGKSTLVSLLPRFYELDRGSIKIDGIDIREFALESLRDQIALVSQHITLFNDTIGNNIGYGRRGGATDEEIRHAASHAHALEFIEQLPEGFNTMVGENGVLLSGGQRQRIAIARALLKDAPILILDEATSALDTQSERHIQAALEELMQNRTTLVIAHRLSTIESADKIVVLDHGEIVETGRHETLLANGGAYAALHNMQFHD